MKQQFVVTYTIRQTEIPTLLDSWFTNTPSVKMLLPQEITAPDISFRSPSLFYLLTAGVEVVYFHLITLRHTPQSVGLLWARDRPVAETST
jgi:hypothetical protein